MPSAGWPLPEREATSPLPDLTGSLQMSSLQDRYASGTLHPADVIRAVYDGIDRRGDDGVWITVVPRAAAVARAEQLRVEGPASRPLYGLPFAVKDNIDVASLPTTAACPAYSRPTHEPATLVRRLEEAGAILIGKTNLDQFATGLTGTRSPYGIPRSPIDAQLIPGGSSSGSAVAVSAGLLTFAIGTDTAGSGRVPAAMTNTVGVKPSRGLVSTAGIVPACRSLDCPSVHALSVEDASAVLAVLAAPDPADPWSRALPVPGARPATVPPGTWRLAVPDLTDADFLGDTDAHAGFTETCRRLRDLGAQVVPVDLEPFLAAGRLLYEGPWLAERLSGLVYWLDERPDALHPVIRQVLAGGRRHSAVDAFLALHELQRLRRHTGELWSRADALLLPTAPRAPTVEEVLADPIARNAELGRYTTFVNLLDLAAVAVPQGTTAAGRPHGVSLAGPAGSDPLLLGMAAVVHRAASIPLGSTAWRLQPPGAAVEITRGWTPVAVAGAHMSGLSMHHRLTELGAVLIARTATAPIYRLLAVAGDPPRPGLVHDQVGGAALEVETYHIRIEALGVLTTEVGWPLALGHVQLADGTWVPGYVCAAGGEADAADITRYGGWRTYLRESANVRNGRS
jgi:allophanate hydrolase